MPPCQHDHAGSGSGRHPRRLAAAAILAALASAAPGDVRADGPPGLRRVAARLFLAPDLPARYAEDEDDFLPLTEMEWVQALVEADPLLAPQGVVLHVRRLPSPPAWLFGPEGIPRTFGNREGVPEALRFEGLDAQTKLDIPNPQRFNYRPEGPEPGFMLTCADPDPTVGVFDFCGLLVTYPPDPAITLAARFYSPEPFQELAPRLPALAERMRELALCLDVTEAPPPDPDPDPDPDPAAALASLLAANPMLEECRDGSSS